MFHDEMRPDPPPEFRLQGHAAVFFPLFLWDDGGRSACLHPSTPRSTAPLGGCRPDLAVRMGQQGQGKHSEIKAQIEREI